MNVRVTDTAVFDLDYNIRRARVSSLKRKRSEFFLCRWGCIPFTLNHLVVLRCGERPLRYGRIRRKKIWSQFAWNAIYRARNRVETTTETTDAVVYAAASAIGIVAGMRAMTAPAVVSYIATEGCLQNEKNSFGLLGHPKALRVMIGLASGELIFDKLPFMPKRTDSAGLAARIISGALCGATICKAKNRSIVVGAIAGTFGAIGSTFAVFNVRQSLARELHIPDPAIALLEDATAIWAGKVICEGLKRS